MANLGPSHGKENPSQLNKIDIPNDPYLVLGIMGELQNEEKRKNDLEEKEVDDSEETINWPHPPT